MTNGIQEGRSITVPAPEGGVTSGGLVVIGSLIGVAGATAAAGADVALDVEGAFELPAASAVEIAVGELLYLDTGELTNVGDDTTPLVGVAVGTKAALALTVNCKLGSFGLAGPAGK
jgi:predicted RecA/RadA family phage recombinase